MQGGTEGARTFWRTGTTLWAKLRHKYYNAQNMIANNSRRWEQMYEVGNWNHLRSLSQRPRHYLISGIIHDCFPNGGSILDVGCGYGTLYPLIRGPGISYAGIDVAPHAIRACLEQFANEGCTFEVAAFESFRPTNQFDVVVMKEILYYFPVCSVGAMFHKVRSLLREGSGKLIVSMQTNIVASCIWRYLRKLAVQEQSISVSSLTGGPWTVRVYNIHDGSRF